ncbi:MAG: hypothetical protein KBT10_05160 [Bacteroidales bacterium]|nr:hypothetical protein [Candidatus Sodaliphilus aphodohippi]
MKNKTFTRIFLALALLTSAFNLRAEDVPGQVGDYVTEINVFATDTWDWTWGMTPVANYMKTLTGDWTGAYGSNTDYGNYGDTNSGAGGHRVFILYKTTNDPKDAITDIILVSLSPDDYSYAGDRGKTIKLNGKTYYPAGYGPDSGGGNLNRGTGSSTKNLYLYYTKDGNKNERNSIIAGESIVKKLTLEYYDSKCTNPEAAFVKRYDPYSGSLTSNADTNEGCGGSSGWIYIKKHSHTHKNAAKDLNPCDCKFSADNFAKPLIADSICHIECLRDLCWWRDNLNANNSECPQDAIINEDIDMKNISYTRDGQWEPICVEDSNRVWTGTLDGNGHCISNLKTYIPRDDFGLFGLAGGTIKNLSLKDVDIDAAPYSNAAAFAVKAMGQITFADCDVSGYIRGVRKGAAGYVNVGDDSTKVVLTRCQNHATVVSYTNDTDGFGFVGKTINSLDMQQNVCIDRCINYGDVRVAFAHKPVGSITNCLNLDEGSVMMSKYVGNQKLNMDGVLNAGSLQMDYDNAYSPQPNCYTTYPSNDYSYEEGAVTKSQIASGEACYLLNACKTNDDVVWRQKIGTDSCPTPLHDDADILRIVYKFEKDDIRCPGTHYTNSWFYAQDHQGGGHEFVFTPGNVTSEGLDVAVRCAICGKESNEIAVLESERTIKERACREDGVKLLTFTLDKYEKTFTVQQPIPNMGCDGHFSSSMGHHNILECAQCGEEKLSPQYTLTVVDGIWQINNIYDWIAYLDNCIECSANAADAPSALICTDLDMNDASHLASGWAKRDSNFVWRNATLDGAGHTIKGLYVNSTTNTSVFGKIINGTVKNLTIDGIAMGDDCALLCRSAQNSTFEKVIARGEVIGGNSGAGLCYSANASTFTECRNYASVQVDGNSAGGIAAIIHDGSLERTTNHGNISGAQDVGGLAGNYYGYFEINNCGNYGDVRGANNIGGIVGAFAIPEFGQDNILSCVQSSTLNVGNVILTGENYNTGGFSGLCNLPDDSLGVVIEMIFQNSVFKGAQVPVGHVVSSTGITPGYTCTDQQLASGEICYKLNNQQTTGDPVWHQNIGVDPYPYPFGDNVPEPTVFANDEIYFIPENSTVDSFELHPVKVGDRISEFYFHTNVRFNVTDMKYKRNATLAKGQYTPVYLPFAFNDPSLVILEFEYYDKNDSTAYFSRVDDAKANHPYLVGISNLSDQDTMSVEIAAANAVVELEPSQNVIDFPETTDLATGFYGTFKPDILIGYYGYYCYNTQENGFCRASESGTNLPPFQCTFKLDEAPSPMFIKMAITDSPTGISTINANSGVRDTNVYNITGQCVGTSLNNLPPGIYIYNGKKICIKNQ